MTSNTRTNSIKTVGDSLALQITLPARDAMLVEERDVETHDPGQWGKKPTYRAAVRVYAFENHLLVVDRDRMTDAEIAELVVAAASATNTAYRAMNTTVQVKGHGYMVTLPPGEDAGFRNGDRAPIATAQNLVVIIHGDEAKAGFSKIAEMVTTIRQEQIQDREHR